MAKKLAVKACPNCGSAELEWIGGGANAVFDFTGASGLSGLLHCANCGRDVLPLEFPSEEARKKFVSSSQAGKESAEHKPGEKPQDALPREEVSGEGVPLSQGYAAFIGAAAFAIGAISFFLLFVTSGSVACGLLPAIAFALLAAYFYLSKPRKQN